MISYIARKIFGTRNDRVIRTITPVIQRVAQLEPEYKKLSDEQLAKKTIEFKERIERGESLDDLRGEAFAAVSEASSRVLGMRHYDVQIIGGCILHTGRIAEMKTGEGKTLTATLPVYLNALTGKGVHLVTVNDYLAKRDAEWMGRVYRALGMSTGVIYSGMSEQDKRSAYAADITYGQNNEFGFDYLRDNMKYSLTEQFQRGHSYAIVDEVDSILIDEARTPLIISGPAEDATELYYSVNKITPLLRKDSDFELDLKTKTPTLTEQGVARCEDLLKIENLYDPTNIEVLHHIVQSLKAYHTFQRDQDYVVQNGQVIIVDEFTGRLMPGRRWSDGQHQAIEAKEGLKIARENQTLASITFQNYFRMYDKLAGMTGTADTEAVEFKQIYNLEVIAIPPNKSMVREDLSDLVYRTRKEKYEAVVEDIEENHKSGQPMLVGTISIEQSELLSKMLKAKGVPHNVLNAKQHDKEAEIVAQAGRFGSVTISTNMAGRGTDILLGGNAEFLAAAEAKTRDREDPAYQAALEKYSALCAEEKKKVIEAGGLFIMGTERHESRRIDNQLRGRAGRQGDPGKSRFYISLEDDLMMRFGGDKIQSIMTRLGWEEGVAMDGNLISRTIESAQKRVEMYHFESRKHVTEYDDVMNKQRQVIYNLRHRILSLEEIAGEVEQMIEDQIENAVLAVCDQNVKPIEWDLTKLSERFQFLFAKEFNFSQDAELTREKIFETIGNEALAAYQDKAEEIKEKLTALSALRINDQPAAPISVEEFQQKIILETLDHFWNLHLKEMDHLREGINLRGYGQKNPLYEYQREGFELFQAMLNEMCEQVIRRILHSEIASPKEIIEMIESENKRRDAVEKAMSLIHPAAEGEKPEPK